MSNSDIKLEDWDFRYIWGFANTDPCRECPNDNVIAGIVETVVGQDRSYLATDTTFHPYHLLNEKNNSIWMAMLLLTQTFSPQAITEIMNNQSSTIAPGKKCSDKKVHIWKDERLADSRFKNQVPFVLPFLTYRSAKDKPNANTAKSNVAQALRWEAKMRTMDPLFATFIPRLISTVGIGKFKPEDPSQLVEEIVLFESIKSA